jgi:hypothetical protein
MSTRIFERGLLCLLACIVFTTSSGCVVAAVGAVAALSGSSYDYSKGTLTGQQKESLAKSWDVTQDVAREQLFHIVEVSKSETEAAMLAVSPDDSIVRVELKAHGKSRTDFSIRIGEKGDEKKSASLWKLIRKRL